ncbi:hypothetical protein EDD11_002504 [Mortierella claussenii]|nr:hypothetical protein EDD11_002504 [Mortierella claussenii]
MTAAEELYQDFRSRDRIVRIQVYPHPVSGQSFVLWTDIVHCFPGCVRIQYRDVFVPLIRNESLYRIKPHGISYHPDVVLDVVYDQPQARIKSRPISTSSFLTAAGVAKMNLSNSPSTSEGLLEEADEHGQENDQDTSSFSVSSLLSSYTMHEDERDSLQEGSGIGLHSEPNASDGASAASGINPTSTSIMNTVDTSTGNDSTLTPSSVLASSAATANLSHPEESLEFTEEDHLDLSALRAACPPEMFQLVEPIFQKLHDTNTALNLLAARMPTDSPEREAIDEARAEAQVRFMSIIANLTAAMAEQTDDTWGHAVMQVQKQMKTDPMMQRLLTPGTLLIDPPPTTTARTAPLKVSRQADRIATGEGEELSAATTTISTPEEEWTSMMQMQTPEQSVSQTQTENSSHGQAETAVQGQTRQQTPSQPVSDVSLTQQDLPMISKLKLMRKEVEKQASVKKQVRIMAVKDKEFMGPSTSSPSETTVISTSASLTAPTPATFTHTTATTSQSTTVRHSTTPTNPEAVPAAAAESTSPSATAIATATTSTETARAADLSTAVQWKAQSERLKKEISRLAAMKRKVKEQLAVLIPWEKKDWADQGSVADEKSGLELESELIDEKQRKLFKELYQLRDRWMNRFGGPRVTGVPKKKEQEEEPDQVQEQMHQQQVQSGQSHAPVTEQAKGQVKGEAQGRQEQQAASRQELAVVPKAGPVTQLGQKQTSEGVEEEAGSDEDADVVEHGQIKELKLTPGEPIQTQTDRTYAVFERGRASLIMTAFEVQRAYDPVGSVESWETRARRYEKAAQAMWVEDEEGNVQSPLSIVDVVGHRGSKILARRFNWLDNPSPHLMVMLPGYSERVSIATLKWQDFQTYFLCECGDLPMRNDDGVEIQCRDQQTESGKVDDDSNDTESGHHTNNGSSKECHCIAHLDLTILGYPVQKNEREMGPQMMALLEMLLYGGVIGGKLKVEPLEDGVERKRAVFAIQFLMEQGVESSYQLIAKGCTSLDEIQPIEPLTESQLMELYRTRLAMRRPVHGGYAFRTLDGDLRWLCQRHHTAHAPEAFRLLRQKFVERTEYPHLMIYAGPGSVVATIRSRELARTFFDLIQLMISTPAVSVFLDWDFNSEDIADLHDRMSLLPTACLKIYVRDKEDSVKTDIFGHRLHHIIMEAVRNKNIQVCVIERRGPGENSDSSDELFAYKGAMYLDPIVAWFIRESNSPKVQLGLLVSDLSKAAKIIRLGLRGFHALSKLTLEASYWDHIEIQFGSSSSLSPSTGAQDDSEDQEKKEEEEEDVNYLTESQVDFFNRRKNDVITVRTYLSGDTEFLLTHALREVTIRISFPEDGPRIRELIKNNRKLRMLDLSIACKDDPCQVFEYFKSLMQNHPSMESLHLCKDWGKTNKSTFVWHGVSDRSKMTLSIMSYLEDKIGPLLQKFGTCLLQLFINNINAADAAILERVTRSRKGQLKLATIAIVDVFMVQGSSLDELAKVVLRTPLQQFRITGTVVPKSATRVSEFMAKVANKITEVHFYGEATKAILTELEKRMPETSNMVLLKELRLSGPFMATTKDLAWIRSLLRKPVGTQPIRTIELHKVNLSHQGWMTLAQEIDLKRLKYLRIGPDTPMKNEAIRAFVMAVPYDSELENFHLDSDGVQKGFGLAYKNILMPQLKKKTALVSIGRHF